MAERWTIPAAALEVLGGLEEDDPPAIASGNYGETALMHPFHPRNRTYPHILLPQSSPALLRVLARHVRAPPHDVPRLDDLDGAGFWTLRSSRLISFRHEPLKLLRGDPLYHVVPTLEGVTDPTQALAEVVVWMARLQRLQRLQRCWGDGGDARILTALGMERAEALERLPAWGVTRG